MNQAVNIIATVLKQKIDDGQDRRGFVAVDGDGDQL